jgi:RHS repeat-associated protein
VTAPASIPELARALKYDANLIYEYVYTNIEYSPTYGLKKGALGTLLDGVGNDMDQSALLVALLRASGYTATYQYGQIRLFPADIAAFYGVDVSNACPLANLLTRGGIPVTIYVSGTPVCTSPLAGADVTHTWVTVTGGSLGATTYVLDPSYKSYVSATGINLATATGYDQASLLSSAKSGASFTPGLSIQNVNSANIASSLTTYANSLVSSIRASNPTATTREVLGGNYIQPLSQPYALPTSLAYQTPGTTPVPWTGDVPDARRTTLRVQIGGIDQTYFGDAIYGHRLSIVYDASARPVLYLDGVAQGSAGTAGANTISYTVSFPFCFATGGPTSPGCGPGNTNLFTAQNIVSAHEDYAYAIVAGWDFPGRGMVDFHRRQLQMSKAAGNNDGSEAVLGEALNMVGYAWLAQLGAASSVNDRIVGTKTIAQCFVGVVAQVEGPYIDMPGGFVSISSLSYNNSVNKETTSFFATGGALSALEWGALEQNLPKTGVGAVSTIKLLDLANAQGDVIYDTTSANWGTVKPLLVPGSYSTSDMNEIEAYLASPNNYRLVLPQRGNLSQGLWSGAGYIGISPVAADGSRTITYKISSNLKGGYTTEPVADFNLVPVIVTTAVPYTPPPQVSTLDPIDLSSGGFQYDVDDLALGSVGFPIGLQFRRSYNSNNLYTKGPLGAGWTHGFSVNAAANSDGLKGMGQDSPIDGAAFIAAAYVAQDLLNDPAKPFDKLVIASLVQKWLMDRLINNTVNVTSGSQGEQFVQLADGSYNPRLGSSSRLGLDGGVYTLRSKEGATLTFNSAGDLATWQNPAGVSVVFSYDASTPPQLLSVSNNLGRALNFVYNVGGQLTSVSDNASPSRSVTYAYDGAGNLRSATDPLGNATVFAYTVGGGAAPAGLLRQIFGPANPGTATVTNVYDSLGRVSSQTNANGGAWNYFFAGYRSEEDDPYGTRHVLYYNPRGKALFDIQDYGGFGLTTKFLYDGLDRTVSTTLPESGGTTYAYDAIVNPWANNVASVTRNPKPGSPLSPTTTTFTYEPTFNKPTSVTDPLGRVTAMTYDAGTGNLLSSVVDSTGLKATTRFSYNGVGLPLTTTDPLGVTTAWVYDGAGNRTSQVADAGPGRLNQTIRWSYDSAGNPISVTDPRGNITASTWDDARRLLTVTAPPAATGAVPIRTANTWDADGRLLQVRQSAGMTVLRTTSATYTLTGKTASTTDANGSVTRFAYDRLDRLAGTTDAVGGVTRYTYDALSRPYQMLNPAITGAISGGALLQQTWTADGQRASLTDANANTTAFAYDGFDRLTATIYPGGSTETLAYDADGNVTTRCTRAGQPIGFTYDTLNRLTTKTLPGSAATCGATPSGTVVTYGWDLAGRRTGFSDNGATIPPVATPTSTVAYTSSYSYDALNRLTAVRFGDVPAATPPSSSSTVTFRHGYNAANQRNSLSVDAATPSDWIAYPPATASTTGYTANSLNQYTCVGVTAPSCAGAVPAYDSNGNLTDDGSTYTFDYDAENRLVTAKTRAGATIATYTFDARGRRKSKTVGGTTTVFVTDPDNREILEYDAGTGAIQRWYPYGLGPNAVLGQINVAAGIRSTPVPDLLGSIIGVMDASRGTLSSFAYRPYGSASSTPDAFGYTGQRVDAESSLYYYRARYYSSVLGRFLQVDPSGYDAGLLLYAYVSNDPLNLIDPTGLGSRPGGFGAGFGAGFVGLLDPNPLSLLAVLSTSFPQDRTGSSLNQAGVVTGIGAAVVYSNAISIFASIIPVASGEAGVANSIPSTLARVIPEGRVPRTLGPPGATDVFVTAAEDIAGMNAGQIAKRLTIDPSPTGFRVIEFPTPGSGIATPVFRPNTGFVGGGRTAGGAREFVIPNQPVPPGSVTRIVP